MTLKLKASVIVIVFIIGATLLSYPGTVSCALLTSDELTENKASLLSAAKTRITEKFGPMGSDPTVVFVDNAKSFWPLALNDYGSTSFVGFKTCVTIGPKGQNIDVVAHELMHAEIEHRVGFWGRTNRLPVWFEEGLAMQVDLRPRFDLAGDLNTSYVTQLNYAKIFFVSDPDSLTANYTAAKVEVSQWEESVGSETVYQLLEQIKEGAEFSSIWPPVK